MIEEQATSVHEDSNLCLNCKSTPYLEQYPNKLCGDCRQLFINYPIPRWIWLFAGAVLITMAIGAFRMPAYLSAGIKLSRAEKAIEAKRYLTAQRELTKVIETFPDNIMANGKMVIACAYNWDLNELRNSYNVIEGKEINDENLLSQINEAMRFVEECFPKDTSLIHKIEEMKDNPQELNKLFLALDSTYEEDVNIAGVTIANKLYDLKQYDAAEQVIKKILDIQSDYRPALSLLAAIKRNKGDFDEAIKVCKQALLINLEDVSTIAQMARIELKRSSDKQAAIYAKEAIFLNPDNIYAMEAQAMVDFYANNSTKSQRLLSGIKKQEAILGDSSVSTRLAAIINGSEIYR